MICNLLDQETRTIDLARESVYRFLALVLRDPRTPGWQVLFEPANQDMLSDALTLLRSEAAAVPGLGELPQQRLDFQPLRAAFEQPHAKLIAEYEGVFGLVYAQDCPPYETEYHPSSEPFFRAQEMADVAGFYRAFGLQPGTDVHDRPDHVTYELEFMAFLCMKQRLALENADAAEALEASLAETCADAQYKFFRDHLSWWLPAFAMGLRRKGEDSFYTRIGEILAAFLPIERQRWQIAPPRVPLLTSTVKEETAETECAGCA